MRESWDVTIRGAGQTHDDGNLVARWVCVLMRMCRKEVMVLLHAQEHQPQSYHANLVACVTDWGTRQVICYDVVFPGYVTNVG